MTNEINQDPQKPTQDQPPPKQYATPRPGESGERGTDERTPTLPDRVESSEGNDEDRIAGEEGPGYDQNASPKDRAGRSSTDKRSTQSGGSSEASKPGGQTGQSSGSSGGAGKPSGAD